MGYKFGRGSKINLGQIGGGLVAVANLALSYGIMDFTVVEGARGKAEQNRLYSIGKSQALWPNSKHNIQTPDGIAEAMDCAPWINGGISWNWYHCAVLSGIMQAAAASLGVPLRWGGNWDMDGEPITDQDFQDLVHYEKY